MYNQCGQIFEDLFTLGQNFETTIGQIFIVVTSQILNK